MLPIGLTEVIQYQPGAAGSHLSPIHSPSNSFLNKYNVPHAVVDIRNTEIKDIILLFRFSPSTGKANKLSLKVINVT